MRRLLLGCVVLSFIVWANGLIWADCTPVQKDGNGVYVGQWMPKAIYTGLAGWGDCYAGMGWDHIKVQFFGGQGCADCSPGEWVGCGYIDFRGAPYSAGCADPLPCPKLRYSVGFTYQDSELWDSDCDGVPDAYDQDPYNPPADADGDGILDDLDPWPNDPDLPLGKQWVVSGRYVHKDSGCVHTEYSASDGSGYTFFTTNCGAGVDPATTPLEDWWLSIPYNNPPKDYEDIIGEGPGGTSGDPNPQTIDGDLGALLREMERNTRATEGSYGELVKANQKLTGIDASGISIDSKLSTTNQKLGEIKDAIEGMQGPSMTGVETRLDAIHEDMPKMGSGDLPDADTSMFETETLLGAEAVAGYKTESKSALFALFDWFLANNPIAQVVENFEFSASGECSLNVPMGDFGSMNVNAGEYAGFLQMLGVIMVALATISGVLLILES